VECVSEWVRGVNIVVALHTLDGQVEAVGDAPRAPTGLVNCPLPFNLIARPENHPADGVSDRVEGIDVGGRQLTDNHPHVWAPGESREDGITRQKERAQFRVVKQRVWPLTPWSEFEVLTLEQLLAPQQEVIAQQCLAGGVRIRVRAGGVGAEVECDINRHRTYLFQPDPSVALECRTPLTFVVPMQSL
jgi:hypothetical protein